MCASNNRQIVFQLCAVRMLSLLLACFPLKVPSFCQYFCYCILFKNKTAYIQKLIFGFCLNAFGTRRNCTQTHCSSGTKKGQLPLQEAIILMCTSRIAAIVILFNIICLIKDDMPKIRKWWCLQLMERFPIEG